MHKFVRNLLTEWRKLKLPSTDKTFVAAISGGADSMSLALALHELKNLKKLNLRFVIAHFNHDLRGADSAGDADFVKDFAVRFGFELALKVQGLKFKDQKGNLEQNARRARYDFLLETADNVNAVGVLTAHTLNDQAETFLINLIRGSGLAGLGAMKIVGNGKWKMENGKSADEAGIGNPQSAIRLIRPLLSWARRTETENFCRERDVDFRFDAMNEDLAFRRVRIRKILLPMLAEFNPQIIKTLARTAFLLQDDFAELERKAAGKFEKEIAEELTVKELKDIFPAMRRQILRGWLRARRGDLRRLDAQHLAAIERLIDSRKSGKIVELPNGETIIKENGKLRFQYKG